MEEFFAEESWKLLIILIAAWLAGELSLRLGQAQVIGGLAVGIVIGPAGIDLLNANDNKIVFFLASVGLIALLFEAGLETNLAQLKKDGVRSLAVAIIGVFVPLTLGYLAMLFWFRDSLFALFVGAAMTATSVGITMGVLSELKKFNTVAGRIIMGAAVLDDIIGLILLSVLLGVAEGSSVSVWEIAKILGLSSIFLLAALGLGIKFAPVLMKFVRQMKSSGSVEVFAFLLCLGMAALASELGMALIVGAFLAGLMLEQIEEKEHILPRMQFIRLIFVPVFFVTAGTMFNPRVINNNESVLVLAVLLFIAMAGKLLSGLGASRTTFRQKLTIGVGMMPRGEVGLIFASAGFLSGVFDEKFYSIVVAVIILTTLVTPFILKPLIERK